MEKEYVKIPESISIGGQSIEIKRVERCEDNCLGRVSLAKSVIEIADIVNKDDNQADYF